MKKEIRNLLKFMAEELKPGKFYLPDGLAGVVPPGRCQPNDRLLFLLKGVKYEPMSLNGRLETVELHPGDAWLVSRDLWEYSAVTTKHAFLSLVFMESCLRMVYYSIPAGKSYGYWQPPDLVWHTLRPVPADLTAVIAALKNPASEQEPQIPHLLRAVLWMAYREAGVEGHSIGKARITFERVRSCLAERFTDPGLSRDQIAAQLKMNPAYISQLIHRMTGMNFQDYVSSCRMTAAIQYLRGSYLTMKEIAFHCGFSSEVYFIRRFRELYGVPPGKYRTRLKENKAASRV